MVPCHRVDATLEEFTVDKHGSFQSPMGIKSRKRKPAHNNTERTIALLEAMRNLNQRIMPKNLKQKAADQRQCSGETLQCGV